MITYTLMAVAILSASSSLLAEESVRQLNAEEKKVYDLGKAVYLRDAHCASCHQLDGKGARGIYPPLAGSKWIDDDERFIKITLKGLWGTIEVKGKKYDSAKGVPPMMGFASLLTDEEMAAVLSYIRRSFGNRGKFITEDQVKRVREATKGRASFYMSEEILKMHPL